MRERFRLDLDFGEGLSLTSLALKEWVGLVAYWLLDRTDTLFPGPQAPAG
jgi:hypothetical protein